VPTLEDIRRTLAGHEPELVAAQPRRHAAVAMILREADPGPEVLFIERAKRRGDPWSGHMAFPGGRIEPVDRDARDAAERETLEEVGLSLAGAEPLGRLGDLRGRHAGRPDAAMVVSAFVYHASETEPLRLNGEVAQRLGGDYRAAPDSVEKMRALAEAERQVDFTVARGTEVRFPGIRVGEDRHVVWGLTYRFLEVFHELVGRPLPDRWSELGLER